MDDAIKKRRRLVRSLLSRWRKDLVTLENEFGPYDQDNYTDGAEMQRNLGTASVYAEGELAKRT